MVLQTQTSAPFQLIPRDASSEAITPPVLSLNVRRSGFFWTTSVISGVVTTSDAGVSFICTFTAGQSVF